MCFKFRVNFPQSVMICDACHLPVLVVVGPLCFKSKDNAATRRF